MNEQRLWLNYRVPVGNQHQFLLLIIANIWYANPGKLVWIKEHIWKADRFMVVMLFPGDDVFLGSLWKAYLKMPGKFFLMIWLLTDRTDLISVNISSHHFKKKKSRSWLLVAVDTWLLLVSLLTVFQKLFHNDTGNPLSSASTWWWHLRVIAIWMHCQWICIDLFVKCYSLKFLQLPTSLAGLFWLMWNPTFWVLVQTQHTNK